MAVVHLMTIDVDEQGSARRRQHRLGWLWVVVGAVRDRLLSFAAGEHELSRPGVGPGYGGVAGVRASRGELLVGR